MISTLTDTEIISLSMIMNFMYMPAIKKLLLSYSLPEKIKSKPVFYEFPLAKHKIGLITDNKLYLIDIKGKMPEGFPLKGKTMFSITHFNSPVRNYYLITGDENGNLVNYEVFW